MDRRRACGRPCCEATVPWHAEPYLRGFLPLVREIWVG